MPTPEYHLVGLFTRYSSWTARVQVLLDYYNISYKVTFFNLYTDKGQETLKKYSPTSKVPVLFCTSLGSEVVIHDSLSICEFLAESHPELPLWPRDRQLRALARSVTAEMHSGFMEVRDTYHSSFTGKYTGNIPITPKGKKEIKRLLQIFGEARKKTVERLRTLQVKDKGFLFGEFGIADAFFWPVLWRFRSYELSLTGAAPEAIEWIGKMWNDPVIKAQAHDYFRQAEDPSTLVPAYEDVFKNHLDIKYEQFSEDWQFMA